METENHQDEDIKNISQHRDEQDVHWNKSEGPVIVIRKTEAVIYSVLSFSPKSVGRRAVEKYKRKTQNII